MDKDKLRYAILKELDAGNGAINEDYFEVTADEFDNQIRFLDREEYITNVHYADDRPYILNLVNVSEKGEQYLKENSEIYKWYKRAKEVRSWLP